MTTYQIVIIIVAVTPMALLAKMLFENKVHYVTLNKVQLACILVQIAGLILLIINKFF